MSAENLFNLAITTAVGFFVSLFWYWINALERKRKEDKAYQQETDKRVDDLEEELHAYKLLVADKFQPKNDMQREFDRLEDSIKGLQKELKEQYTQIFQTLNKKADK